MAPQPFSQALKLYSQRQYAEALDSCRQEARETKRQPGDPLYQRLLDEICMHSAACGQVIGFDGRLLLVLPVGWKLGGWHPSVGRGVIAGVTNHPQLEFASLSEALQAAQDGDVVQLLPGTHVTSQDDLAVNKRVLIWGDPNNKSAVVLDHRANQPAFNISRSCILRGFTVDMVGFTEAITITGASTTVKPILQDLVVCCSGDDGVAVRGKAQPLIRSCDIRARYCSLKQYDHASTTLWQSTLAGGKHALIAAGESQTFCEGCKVQNCSQDAILGLQKARINLTDTRIKACQGPGIDMSDDSSVVLKQVDILECVGGIFLWHRSSCEAICSHITGGATYAVLLDAEAYARGSSCTIDGPCHITNMPGEPEEYSDGASDDSIFSSASPMTHHNHNTAPGGQQFHPTAGQHNSSSSGSHKPPKGQLLTRDAFKASAAARAAPAAAGQASKAMGFRSDAAAAAELHAFGLGSPFGSSNGSAGSTHELEDYEDLLQHHMCVANKAKAAALFPPETGAFAAPEPKQFGSYF